MNKKISQKKFKSTKFNVDQYWKLSYCLYRNDSNQIDYISVIKARSFESAKRFLRTKIKEDDATIKIKILQAEMFHKEYLFKRSEVEDENIINIKDWGDIRKCCFPNENNFLFKHQKNNLKIKV